MELKKKLEELAKQSLPSEDIFLVDVILKGTDQSRKVIVLLDGDNGVNIDSCARVSRGMAAELEENDPFPDKYTLEVSSAGIDHPLIMKRQYSSRIGKSLKLSLKSGEEMIGKLLEVGEDKILIDKEIKINKKQSTEATSIAFDSISKSMVQVSFK